jgi:hypothetical protein
VARPELGSPIPAADQGYLLRLPGEAVDTVRAERGLARFRAAVRAEDLMGARLLGRAALAEWTGPSLGELACALPADADRLDACRADLVEELAAVELTIGTATDLVDLMQRHVQEHPYREHGWALLMRALWAAGRQVEALDCHRRLRRLLLEQLGIEPGPDVRDLHAAMLRGELPTPPLVPARPVPIKPAPPAEDSMSARHDLLSQTERGALYRLTAFPGDFDLAAAAAVMRVPDPGRVLGALVTKSWVVGSGPGRCRMPRAVRSFAVERADPDALRSADAALLAHVLAMADVWLTPPPGGLGDWIRTCAADRHNFDRALELAAGSDDDSMLRVAVALWWPWFWGGRPGAAAVLRRALAGGHGVTALRVQAALELVFLDVADGRVNADQAAEQMLRAFDQARSCGDESTLAVAYPCAASAEMGRGDWVHAEVLAAEAAHRFV